MPTFRTSFAALLARPETRGGVHALVLLVGAALFLGAFLHWQILADIPVAIDKARHYLAGRYIAVTIFYLAYLCIIIRVLLVARHRQSITRVLLFLPVMLAGALLAAGIVVFLIGAAKELIDIGGPGHVEWLDLSATLDGAATIIPPVSLIMVVTPLFIPLDIILQLPRLMLRDVRTGVKAVDQYVRARNQLEAPGGRTDVLLVEDDIVCATTVMNFCRTIGLTCHHTSTIAEADAALRANLQTIRLVILDNFVRADALGRNITGSQWLLSLQDKSYFKNRRYAMVMITGHADLLGKAAPIADLILAKPWSPGILLEFLKKRKILPAQE